MHNSSQFCIVVCMVAVRVSREFPSTNSGSSLTNKVTQYESERSQTMQNKTITSKKYSQGKAYEDFNTNDKMIIKVYDHPNSI